MASDPSAALTDAAILQQKAYRLPVGRQQSMALATAHWLQGEADLRLERLTRAVPHILMARQLVHSAAPGSRLEGDVLLTSGSLNHEHGEPAVALADYQAAFRIFRRWSDERGQARALMSLGTLYSDAQDYRSSLKYFQEATDIGISDPYLLLSLDNNRAVALNELGRHREAEISYQRAFDIAQASSSNLIIATIVANIGMVRLQRGDLAGADRMVNAGLRYARDGGAAILRPQLIALSARVAFQRHDLHRARTLIAQRFAGVDLATTTMPFRSAHETAFQVYHALGEDGLAIAHLIALKRLDDQATRLATSANTALAAARFDFANQGLRIQKLRNEELRRNVVDEHARARLQRFVFLALGVATAILIGLLATGLVLIGRSRNRERRANADLAVTNAALAEALAAKSKFLATTSHEIRTPLNGILGMTQVMLTDRSLPPPIRDRIAIVHDAGGTMKALVDDILDVAKMDRGHLAIDEAPFDLGSLLRDAVKLWQGQVVAKGVAFAVTLDDFPPLVRGDGARVRQIVSNLLANAVKFTDRGKIGLAAENAGDHYRLRISDSGIGISADKHEQIFESFRQADAGTTRRFGGTGLGLHICRRLARAMGGDVSVTSEPGIGSTFTVTLPLAVADIPPVQRARAADVAGILIVDGNPIRRAKLSAVIEQSAGSAIGAAGVAEACACIAAGGIERMVVDGDVVATDADPVAIWARLSDTAAAHGVSALLLWPATAVIGAPALRDGEALLHKPVAAGVMLARLFAISRVDNADTSLVTQAA